MKIVPLAFDSMGVRSMATYVETDQKILIDPGVSIGVKRYGLPPSKLEYLRLEKLSDVVAKLAIKSDILTISHYHYDHFFPQARIYEDKILLIKHPKENINRSQKGRASEFLNFVKDDPETLEYADDRNFEFGKTKIKFSPPFRHGDAMSKLGFVIMCEIAYLRKKLIHATDVQGPQLDDTTQWIINENPDILILSGYATMFIGWKASLKGLEESNRNLTKILFETKVKTMILDHHLVRDLRYKNKIQPVLETAEKLHKKVITAAEYLGREPEFLEARRKEIFKEEKSVTKRVRGH